MRLERLLTNLGENPKLLAQLHRQRSMARAQTIYSPSDGLRIFQQFSRSAVYADKDFAMSRKFRMAYFAHSLRSDWNNGNAHFLRGLLAHLGRLGHEVTVFDPSTGGLSTICAKKS